MKQFLNNFIDFFIKDKSSLSSEIIYQARTISWIFVITSFLSFVMTLLQLFGHFQGEAALPLTIFCVSILLLMKYYGNLKLVSYLFLLGGIIIIVLNINVTGQIYSYNQKWFLLILILSSFSAPKLTLPILIFSCFFQVYSYSSTSFVIQGIASKEEFLYDNISFFIICYLGIVIFNKLKLIQQSRIDTQNSQLRKQQNDLKESNRLLQQRSEQLLESNQELERFAYIASHDLKTPLNNIISFSILLEKELKNYNNKNANQYFNFIKDGSIKMNNLIKDVLEYSKVSSKNIELEEVNLNELIHSINQSISEFINKKNAEVILIGPLPIIRANKTKMYLLFKNLIENGIKYNESATPLVEIEFTEDENSIHFFIQDNGIGIPEKYHQNIFEMFSRLHRDSEYEGTGLGLALCKKIIDHLSGTIKVESQIERGTKFIISFDKKHFPYLNTIEEQKNVVFSTSV